MKSTAGFYKTDSKTYPTYIRLGRPTGEGTPHHKGVVQVSCATGVRWAGFFDRLSGAFRRIMTIQTADDIEKFMEDYGVDVVTTQYIDCIA